MPKLIKILTVHHNCHNYLQLSTIVQSQLLFVIIGNNCHNFLELPQLVIIFMICQNCDFWTEFAQLARIVTIRQNWHNWSKLTKFVKIFKNSQDYYDCHNHNQGLHPVWSDNSVCVIIMLPNLSLKSAVHLSSIHQVKRKQTKTALLGWPICTIPRQVW